MSSRREQLLILADRVNALRQDLQRAEAELDTLLEGVDERREPVARAARTNGATTPAPKRAPRGRTEGKIPKKIVEHLSAHPGKAFRAEDLLAVVGAEDAQNVRSALARLARKKSINKIGRGRYQARQGLQLPPLI